MENNPQSQNKQMAFLYTLVGVLILGLILQNLFFAKKLNHLTREVHATVGHPEPVSSSAPLLPRARHSHRSAMSNPAASGVMNAFGDDDPFEAMQRIQERMFRMMNSARTYAPAFMQQMQQDMASDFSPAMDMKETDASYIVTYDIPGLDKDKINITTRNGMLTIQGVRETETQNQDEKTGFYSSERSYGSFARSVALPGPVDESQIKADYKNGVLTITLPKEKGAENSAKKIAVQ